MSAERVEVVVLHTDQGMGTLVRIYESVKGSVELTHLALIDLGCETSTKRYAVDSIDVIAQALDEMRSPKFDFVLISHQDADHWNLLPDLTERLEKKYAKTTVSSVYTGGTNWKHKAADTVSTFAGKWKATHYAWTTSFTDFRDPTAAPTSFLTLAGVNFRILTVNAASTRSVANGTSAVVVVEFDGTNAVLPGDATAETLLDINTTLLLWRKRRKKPIQPCLLLTAPHHGALATIAFNFTTKKPNLEVATEFARFVDAGYVAASAGYESKFRHPYKNVMAILSVSAGKTSDKHTYVVYNNVDGEWEATKDTKQNVFTTICSLDDPPVRQSWYFTIWPKGKVSIEARLTPASAREQAALGRSIAAAPRWEGRV